jgi:hypothetical protein
LWLFFAFFGFWILEAKNKDPILFWLLPHPKSQKKATTKGRWSGLAWQFKSFD